MPRVETYSYFVGFHERIQNIDNKLHNQMTTAILQEQYGEYNESELKAMDQRILELNDELTKLRQQCKSQESGNSCSFLRFFPLPPPFSTYITLTIQRQQ